MAKQSQPDRLRAFAEAVADFDSIEKIEEAAREAGTDDAGAIGLLIQLLQEKQLPVARRVDAARAIGCLAQEGRLSARQAVPALIEALREPHGRRSDHEINRCAARALGAIGPDAKEAIPALIAALEHPFATISGEAAEALGSIGSEAQDAIPRLVQKLHHPASRHHIVYGTFPWAAGSALGMMGAVAVPWLVEVLGDESALVRQLAVEALGEIGSTAKPAVPRLLALREDPDEEVRSTVLGALREIGWEPDDPLSTWAELLVHGEDRERYEAVQAFRKLGGRALPALSVLIRAVEDEEANIRWRAIAALRNLGPAAQEAVPVLSKALADPNDFVRSYAALALYRISPEAPRELKNDQPPGWVDMMRRDLRKMAEQRPEE
jgi:HEAT repeat protein